MPINHQQQAAALAIRLAVAKLANSSDPSDLSNRCARLGLAAPASTGGKVCIPLLGRTLELHAHTFAGVIAGTGKPPKPAERLLALHYLLCDLPVSPENRWITFRDFPGGAFYWRPFLARSIHPLIQAIGNDLGKLRERLTRLDAKIEGGPADTVSARIVAIGRVEVLLVYRPGDEEFPPSADLLYDACARRVFGAEDAAMLGGRVCFGLSEHAPLTPRRTHPPAAATPVAGIRSACDAACAG